MVKVRNLIILPLSPKWISTTSVSQKNIRSGVYKTTNNRSRPLTYEQAQKPHLIGVTKAWNSWNASRLCNFYLFLPFSKFQLCLSNTFMLLLCSINRKEIAFVSLSSVGISGRQC